MRKGLSESLIKKLLPDAKWTIAELEEKFPDRHAQVTSVTGKTLYPCELERTFSDKGLSKDAMVTRFAPSPTGFVHIGNIYGMLIDKKLAHQSNGIFYLRVEDTDTVRTVDGGVEIINAVAKKLGLDTDEGPINGGNYGPYYQSQRREIYHSVAAELLAKGLAYPCFMTQKEMDDIRELQEKSGLPTGIYGEYARDRNLSEEEITALLDAGNIPSIRWYCAGDDSKKVFVKDVARGSIAIPEWNKDEVLIKSADGLPTYHFAHLVDDHFMRTTHVVRDESWLGTAALHVMLFSMMGWDVPLYYHTPTLDKIDEETGNRRKLSKRKDPEFSVANWWAAGWPAEAILEYLFNLIASGYEEEKLKNPDTTIWNYPIKIKKMPTSGALFDMKKLEWWAKEFIATMSVDDLTDKVIAWANKYSPEWSARLNGHCDYLHSILSIERENPKRIRKDFITWQQTLGEVSYFFDDVFVKGIEESYVYAKFIPTDYNGTDKVHFSAKNYNEILGWFDFRKLKGFKDKQVLTEFLKSFDINDDMNTWWNKIKDIAANLGIGNGDAAMALRVALTGRTNTPDLYSIMQVMDDKRVRERITKCLK